MKLSLLLLLALPMLAADHQIIPLYPGAAPGSETWNWPETSAVGPNDTILRIGNVTKPTVTVYLPDPAKATGTGMVICPGGGFRILAFNHEGTEVAEYLNSIGVAAFIVKYRVMRSGDENEKAEANTRRPEAIKFGVADALQTMRLVRSRAAEFGIQPDRLGIMGFSAGGWITSAVAYGYDAQSRPNFAAPIYGALPQEFSVPKDAPPLFIVHADDDKTVPSERSIRLYTAWKAAGIPAELHVFAAGGHGFGMRKKNLPVDAWIERLRDWLGAQGLLKKAQ
jgi:acetyl esterase/lipase